MVSVGAHPGGIKYSRRNDENNDPKKLLMLLAMYIYSKPLSKKIMTFQENGIRLVSNIYLPQKPQKAKSICTHSRGGEMALGVGK